MKYLNQLFSFISCLALIAGHINPVYAEDQYEAENNRPKSAPKFTEHAYNRKDFCNGEEGAEKLMTDLQKANTEKFDQIAIYKEEIAALVESDKLLASTREIRERYLHSLAKIAEQDAEFGESLGYAHAAKYDGAVLESITEKIPKPGTSPFIDNVKLKFSKIKKSLSTDLANDTQKKVDEIVTEVPKDISPEQIRNMMQSDSPTINSLLERNLNKDDIIACLVTNKSEEACTKIGISSTDKAETIETLKKEMKTFSSQLKSTPTFTKIDKVPGSGVLRPVEAYKRAKIEEEMLKVVRETKSSMVENSKKLDQLNVSEANKKYLEFGSTPDQVARSDYEKAKEQIARNEKKLVGTDIFFYNPPVNMEQYLKAMGVDINTRAGAMQAVEIEEERLNEAIKDAAIFNKDCNFESEDFTSEKINICHGLISKIVPKVKNLKNSHIEKVAELNSKVQKLASETNFADVENLKKYVAEKYMCSCNQENKKTLSVNKEKESLILRGESCSTQFLTLSKIEGLSSASSAIANALYAHEIKAPMDGESCVMTPEKLKPFSDTCNSNNKYITSHFSDICKQITDEYVVKVQNEELISKQNAKWEKYNQENYVEYNSKSPTGYSAVKKKSTWRVVGEGVLPVLPSALPMWLGNFQMKNNINMLTEQGLLQKQYLHNMDIYNQSPWLYNFNYFGYGNPFMPGTSLTGGSNLGGSGGGFNFGQ